MATGEPVDLACTRCALCAGRTQVVPGKGPRPARLVLVGEAPGADEDRLGEPFVGRAGKILDQALAQAGVDRRAVFITNVVKCRPPGNRRPSAAEAAACRPFLDGEVAAARPGAIVALGKTAAEALTGRPVAVKAAGGPQLARVAGEGRLVWVALHPAAARYNRGAVGSIAEVLRRAATAAAEEGGGAAPPPG
ncbi:MAG TPA: uracil-DNA glycosylase [Candidatus Thermoplasmatota archaeon]